MFLPHLSLGSGGQEKTGWTVYPGGEVLVIPQTPSGPQKSPRWTPPKGGATRLSDHKEQGSNLTEDEAQDGQTKAGLPTPKRFRTSRRTPPPLYHMGDLCFQDQLAQDFLDCEWGRLCVVSQVGESLRILGLIKGPSSCLSHHCSARAVSSALDCAVPEQNGGGFRR